MQTLEQMTIKFLNGSDDIEVVCNVRDENSGTVHLEVEIWYLNLIYGICILEDKILQWKSDILNRIFRCQLANGC